MICKINNIEIGRVDPKTFVDGVDETIKKAVADEPIVATKEEVAALNTLLVFIGGGYLSIR